MEHATIISNEQDIMRKHVSATLRLLDSGATVPFIARYRKEATGNLNETQIESIRQRHEALTEIDKRKEHVAEAITAAGAMTPQMQERLASTHDPVEIEDIYLPFKPRRRTRAQAARELGLEPLAKIIMAQNSTSIATEAKRWVKGEVADADAAIAGALDIVAEWVNENIKARGIVRARFHRSGVVNATVVKNKIDQAANYQNYFDYHEPARLCSSHRYLAIRRGEAEGLLRVSITIDDDEMIERLCRMIVKPGATDETAQLVKTAVADGYRRLMRPSIETEIASELKDRSDTAAIAMFADGVTQLLMASPMPGRRVMAIDPGFKSGCKVVCLDAQGNLLGHDVIYPTPPANDYYGAADTVVHMIDRYGVNVIAIGNGTAGRETERFISSLELPRRVPVLMVSEQGASVYSASEVAREEFPDYDITVRGAISIGRRVIDPLAELVKIDPQSIGVGQYQHDVNPTRLTEALDRAVENCVNSVGVNLNTASKQLLSRVSGIGPGLAGSIVRYRAENGPFTSRTELMNVPRMGDKTFMLCAGFLRIPGAENPLDNTGVHPESYALVERMAADNGTSVAAMSGNRSLLHSIDIDRYVTKAVGRPTLTDIILQLQTPGLDPRVPEQEMSQPSTVGGSGSPVTIADLHLGQVLTGRVNNITAFGVFVDLGIKENGLIHISQLSDDYVASPADVVRIGQRVNVRVMDVDAQRGRIALTLKGVPQL